MAVPPRTHEQQRLKTFELFYVLLGKLLEFFHLGNVTNMGSCGRLGESPNTWKHFCVCVCVCVCSLIGGICVVRTASGAGKRRRESNYAEHVEAGGLGFRVLGLV